MTRCVRRSYRLDLMAAGQPCLLWLSGRDRPGRARRRCRDGGTAGTGRLDLSCRCELTLLPDPVPRDELLADPVAREAEVLRMPAGSNPSWLSAAQFATVLDRIGGR